MKILFLTDNYPPETNAAASRVFERARYWVDWGHEVTILTSAPNFPEGKVYSSYKNYWYKARFDNGIRVVRVKTFISRNEGVVLRTLDFLSYMLTAFCAGLFEEKPDVIISTSPQFFTAVAGRFLAMVKRVPFVFELGDLWPESIKAVGVMKDGLLIRSIEKLELYLYRKAKAVVALTDGFKRNLVNRGIDGNKVFVVLNGVELSKYFPRPKDKELEAILGLTNCFVVGYIGTHGMAHALENVLDSAEILRFEKDIRFIFVGPGAAKEGLITKTSERKLENVVFIPQQNKEEISRYWSLCDVALIHLKNSEVFKTVIPSKIFEAMGMGLPILLAAPEGEASAVVLGDSAGLCVPAEDPRSLAGAVLKLHDDKELCSKLSKKSYEAASDHTREHQARSLMDVFKAVVNT